MNLEHDSYAEDLGYYNTNTTEGLIKSMSSDILNNLINKLVYTSDDCIDSLNKLIDENISPAELLKRIEEVIGDGFSFEAVAVHVKERLNQEFNDEEDVIEKRIQRDSEMEKFKKQVDSEIEYWGRTGKVPPMPDEDGEYLYEGIRRYLMRNRRD